MTQNKTGLSADLLLWRHADAEDGFPDSGRALSKKGLKQAKQMAAWLIPRLPEDCRILVSPAKRAQQTAASLELSYTTEPRVGLQAEITDILDATGWPARKGAVLVVGHQPTLGQLAAKLLTGKPSDWSMKKGALWWFSDRAGELVLRAVVNLELL